MIPGVLPVELVLRTDPASGNATAGVAARSRYRWRSCDCGAPVVCIDATPSTWEYADRCEIPPDLAARRVPP